MSFIDAESHYMNSKKRLFCVRIELLYQVIFEELISIEIQLSSVEIQWHTKGEVANIFTYGLYIYLVIRFPSYLSS